MSERKTSPSGPNKDIERKGLAILRKLSTSGTILLPVIGEIGMFGVYHTSTPCNKPHVKISSEFVRAFLARDWLETVRDGYILSEAGAAWIKRSTATEDPFKAQHQAIISRSVQTDNGFTQTVKCNQMESPLEWLHRRKDRKGNPLINAIQYEAGNKLYSDFTCAQLSQRITADWSPTSGVSKKRKHGAGNANTADIRENVIEAKERFNRALDYIGPEMSGVVVDVCCYLKGLEETEKLKGWPQRSGKVVLQIALSRLARYYGLVGVSGSNFSKTQHYGSKDYRPEL